jgi:HPr kinase/phosphorylase
MSAAPSPGLAPAVHATAVLLGADGVLIRGPSGSGKSTLARLLLDRWTGRGRFAALVADDRVHLTAVHGRLVARAPEAIAGLVEVAGRGLVPVPYEPAAVIRLVVDCLGAEEIARMAAPGDLARALLGLDLPRQPVPARGGIAAALLVETALAALPAEAP